MLIEGLNLNQNLTDERRSFYFSPSKSGSCSKAMYFEFFGYEPEETNQHVFEDGKIHEDLTVQFLQLNNNIEIIDRQRPVNIEIPDKYKGKITMLIDGECSVCGQNVSNCLHGHIDGIFKVKSDDGQEIVGLFEHKAVNDSTIKKYKKQGVWKGYLEQVALYCKGLGLTHGVILIKNKNNATYLEAETLYDEYTDTLYLVKQTDSSGNITTFNLVFPKITEKVFEKFATVEQYIREGRIPDFTEQSSQFCYNCPYRKYCEENLTQEIGNNVLDLADFSDSERKYILSNLGRYFSLLEQKDIIESELEETRNKMLNFFISKKVKSVRIQNIPVTFFNSSRTYYSFDVEKLKEKLNEEDFNECLLSKKDVYIQSIFIPPKKRAILSEIVKSLTDEYKNQHNVVTITTPTKAKVRNKI